MNKSKEIFLMVVLIAFFRINRLNSKIALENLLYNIENNFFKVFITKIFSLIKICVNINDKYNML